MGYAGKWRERERARQLRAESWTLQAIATELGVAKGTVSVWVRDVEFVPKPRNRGHPTHRPHPLAVRKEADLARCRREAETWVAGLTRRELDTFALGLYAGEGSKTTATVSMANTNPKLMLVFISWLRREFEIDERRLRVVLYLHEGLDLGAATAFWSRLLGVPIEQFGMPYRAVADPSIRRAKHVFGCATVRYNSATAMRRVLARIEAISSTVVNPG